jgi:uncharacterized protein with von Willebrand factor type A (vWA) domain
MLEQRDYTLILDKSGSMNERDVGAQSRWQAVQESTLALARRCEQFDPDGLTVYLFSTDFVRFDGVTSDRVAQLFASYKPGGYTNLAAVLQDAFNSYFQRKASRSAKPAGELILVITDGAPSDEEAVAQVIIEATHRMERDDELGVSFIQIGKDREATAFLKRLDDDLEGPPATGFFQRIFGSGKRHARFDICDTVTFEQMEDRPLTEILLAALND